MPQISKTTLCQDGSVTGNCGSPVSVPQSVPPFAAQETQSTAGPSVASQYPLPKWRRPNDARSAPFRPRFKRWCEYVAQPLTS